MENNNIIVGKYPITEIAEWRLDEVTLYTEDESLFNEFSKDEKCLKAEAYRRNGKWLAGDCYFPKGYRETLAMQLKRLGIKVA